MAEKPANRDIETEVLITDTGCSGLTAAIVAHDNGAKVTVIESSGLVGGTTSASGGAAWVPNNHHMVEKGEGPDSDRGMNSFDHYWGDNGNKPNPSLGYIKKPPFYAMQNYCGTLGTKGGPRTNADAQVLHTSGKPIEGLYAAGNVMAVVSGQSYFGAGGTIGPGMTFGYLAAKHVVKQ